MASKTKVNKAKKVGPKAVKAKSETMWMGFSRKYGDVLPWIWGTTRKTCRQQYGDFLWRPHEYIRRKVRIVPLSPRSKR